MLQKFLRVSVMLCALMFVAAMKVMAGDEPAFVKPPESNRFIPRQDALLDKVIEIVEEKCAFAGCHTGANAAKNLDMSEEALVANLVGVRTSDGPWMRVKPGDPASSYLMKKIRGTAGIKGDRMPRGGKPLTTLEIAAIEAWIKSLPANMKVEAPKPEYARAFPGWTIGHLQTTETLDKGAFLYRIAHRFKSPVDTGFDQLFGLDGGAFMMTQVGFPLSDNFALTIERSGFNATFEIGGKWRFLRERSSGSTPISAALYAGVDWATMKAIPDPADPQGGNLSRTAGERFMLFAQLPLSKQLGDRLSVLAVPGVLLNGNVGVKDEDALVTLGVGGRVALSPKYALFAEITPILSGDVTAAPLGGPLVKNGQQLIYDTFAAGLEIKVGGHVFQFFATNSAGNTTNQYLSGGNFDVGDGDLRLGFNIYRVLNYPF